MPAAIDPEVYHQVFSALQMGHHGATKATKDKNKAWYKVNRLIRKWPSMQIQTVHNPVSGHLEERLVLPSDNIPSFRIIVKTDEIDMILGKFYLETLGDGAGKLSKRIQKIYIGLNERNIQKWLNGRQSVQQNRPLFTNCAPLIPVEAKNSHGEKSNWLGWYAHPRWKMSRS